MGRRVAVVAGHGPTADHELFLDPFWGKGELRLAQMVLYKFGRLRSI